MRRILLALPLVAASVLALATPAWAGSPHFVHPIDAVRVADSLTVSGKEAGLGNETQVHIEVTATALCVNGGGNHPHAANKEDVAAEGDFPVQNGKAEFSLTLTAVFQPDCAPPMSVVFTDVVVSDTEHGLTEALPGTF